MLDPKQASIIIKAYELKHQNQLFEKQLWLYKNYLQNLGQS